MRLLTVSALLFLASCCHVARASPVSYNNLISAPAASATAQSLTMSATAPVYTLVKVGDDFPDAKCLDGSKGNDGVRCKRSRCCALSPEHHSNNRRRRVLLFARYFTLFLYQMAALFRRGGLVRQGPLIQQHIISLHVCIRCISDDDCLARSRSFLGTTNGNP